MNAIAVFFEQLITDHGIGWIIGQGFGVIAILCGFISYQVRTQRQLLLMQSITAVVFSTHYALIGAYTAMALNLVNIARNAAYDYRLRKGITNKIIPIFFVAVQTALGLLTFEAWYSILVIIGIGANTYCMSFSNPQNVRKSILFTCPLVLTYDLLVQSVGGCIYETVAIVSGAIGISRFAKQSREASALH